MPNDQEAIIRNSRTSLPFAYLRHPCTQWRRPERDTSYAIQFGGKEKSRCTNDTNGTNFPRRKTSSRPRLHCLVLYCGPLLLHRYVASVARFQIESRERCHASQDALPIHIGQVYHVSAASPAPVVGAYINVVVDAGALSSRAGTDGARASSSLDDNLPTPRHRHQLQAVWGA